MSRVTARIFRKESDGNGLVRFDQPNERGEYGLLSSRTANFGRIWETLRVGSPVAVELDSNKQGLPRIKKIDLIP